MGVWGRVRERLRWSGGSGRAGDPSRCVLARAPGRRAAPTHLASPGSARTAPQQAEGAAGGPAHRGSGQRPPSAGESLDQAELPAAHPQGPSCHRVRAGPAGVREPSGHQPGSLRGDSCALLGPSLGPLPLLGSVKVSTGWGRPGIPGQSSWGPGQSLGRQSPRRSPCAPQPYLPLG